MPLLEENDERAYERDGDFDFAGLLVLDLKNEIFFWALVLTLSSK